MTTKKPKPLSAGQASRLYAKEFKALETDLTFREWHAVYKQWFAAKTVDARSDIARLFFKQHWSDTQGKGPRQKALGRIVKELNTPDPSTVPTKAAAAPKAKKPPADAIPIGAPDPLAAGEAAQAAADDMDPDEKALAASNTLSTLRPKQEAFCREYLKDLNATQAAVRAGYSPNTACEIGNENLRKPNIVARIKALQAPMLEAHEVTQQRIMQELVGLAFSNLSDFIQTDKDGQSYIDVANVPREVMAALAQFEVIELPPVTEIHSGVEIQRQMLKVKVKTYDKLKAMELMMKRFGLLKEVVQHQGEVNVKMDEGELARRVAFVLASAKNRTGGV